MRTTPSRILLVEDQEGHIDLIRRAFDSGENHYVLNVARTLEEALEFIDKNSYELVITDLHLPDGDGTALLKNKNTFPCIIMTGNSDESRAVNAMKAGAMDYIIKSDQSLTEIPRIAERSIREWDHILERKKAENSLRESEEIYSTLVEKATDAVMIIQDGVFKFINKPGASTTGYDVEDLLDKSPVDLVLPESKELCLNAVQKLYSGEKVPDHMEIKGRRKDGSIQDLDMSLQVIQYKDRPAVMCIIRDISERKKIEKALIESEEKYRTLQENLPVGISRMSPDGKFFYANPACMKVFGIESERELYDINVVNFYNDKRERNKLIDKLKKEKSVTNYELQMKRRDGTIFWVSTSIKGVFNDQGVLSFMDVLFSDISERKKTEIALKKNEELYLALFHNNPIQTVVVDNEGRIIAFNKAKELSGDRLPRMGNVMYKDYASFHKVDMHQKMMECISSGRMAEFPEMEYKGRVLSIKISPFEQGAIIASQDITNQKKAEERLREREDKYRLITNNMSDLVAMCNSEGIITFTSPSIQALLGYSPFEAIGKSVYEDVHPDDLPLIRKKNEDSSKDLLPVTTVFRQRHKDGHYIWAETYSHSIINSNGEFIGAVFILRDITRRKIAEEKIEHLNELLFSIRNIDQLIANEKNTSRLIQGVCDSLLQSRGHSNVWIVLTDNRNNAIAVADSGFERRFFTFLKTQKSIASLNCFNQIKNSDFAIIDKSSSCGNCKFISEDQNAGRVMIRLEYNNNLYGVMNVGVLPEFIYEEQEKALLQEVAEDIAFGLYNIELEKERKELQKQLYRTARLSAVGQLAAGIAHEFNNLLSVILGHTQLSLEENSIDEIKQSLKEIEKTTKRGSGIVIKLAAFAKPKEPDFKTQDITKIIDEVILLQKRQLHLESIKIETAYNTKSSVPFDRGQMEQVFLNLLINAIHAIKPKNRGKIIIAVSEIERHIEIRFSDNGIGMDKDTKAKVFDPFFTTKGAWAKDGLGISGTGLGLSISHSIIKQHNGTITVKSQKNKGTTFIIKLPIDIPNRVAEDLPNYNLQDLNITKIRGLRILIVDDEDEMVEVFKQIFKKGGFENFRIENNGEKAVSVFREFKPDVVFLDIIMPEMSGEKIFREIRNIDKKIPVVFMSGKIDGEKELYLEEGAFAYIQKPFEKNEIYRVLNRIIEKEQEGISSLPLTSLVKPKKVN